MVRGLNFSSFNRHGIVVARRNYAGEGRAHD
jgi:hypothetical protein